MNIEVFSQALYAPCRELVWRDRRFAAFGFADAEAAVAEHVRPFKLANATETRNTCPYCSVACGIIMYSRGDAARTASRPRSSISKAIPITRPIAARSARRARRCSTSCIADDAHRSIRRFASRARTSGSASSWDDALDRIARLMKDDRDKNFVATNKDGVTVNRWTDHRLPGRVRHHQRNGVPDLQGGQKHRHAGLRQPGACLTRPDGGQSGPDVWPWCDDEFLDRHQERRSRPHHGRQCRRGASVRLQMGHRGEGQPRRQADRRRSALHALGIGCGFLRADPAGHRHRLPARA